MKPQLHLQHPAPFRTAAGNGEERAAQIDRIQERFSRLQQGSEQSESQVAPMVTAAQKPTDH